jgi:hypothetical protein
MGKHEGRHFAGAQERVGGWSRRRKVAAGTATIAVATIVGVAMAAVLARGEWFGSADVTADTDVHFSTVGVPTEGAPFSEDATCSGIVAPDGLSVTLDLDLRTSGWCDLEFGTWLNDTGTTVFRYQDVEFHGGEVEAVFQTASACGAQATGTEAAPQPVRVRFMPAPGFTGTSTASLTAGLTVTDTYNPAICPTL